MFNVPKVGELNRCFHTTLPDAVASIVPVIGNVSATVKVTAEPFPTITLEFEPNVQTASVVAELLVITKLV